MKKNFGMIVALLSMIVLVVAATLLSADTDKEGASEALAAAPVAEETETAEESISINAVAPEERVELTPTVSPTPAPTIIIVESGGDENNGCIGDDGLVW